MLNDQYIFTMTITLAAALNSYINISDMRCNHNFPSTATF